LILGGVPVFNRLISKPNSPSEPESWSAENSPLLPALKMFSPICIMVFYIYRNRGKATLGNKLTIPSRFPAGKRKADICISALFRLKKVIGDVA
jgi:hypothetical protein